MLMFQISVQIRKSSMAKIVGHLGFISQLCILFAGCPLLDISDARFACCSSQQASHLTMSP